MVPEYRIRPTGFVVIINATTSTMATAMESLSDTFYSCIERLKEFKEELDEIVIPIKQIWDIVHIISTVLVLILSIVECRIRSPTKEEIWIIRTIK